MTALCRLCSSMADLFYEVEKWKKEAGKKYYICRNCFSVFMDISNLPSPDLEKSRYLKHNNDVNDHRYQKFVSPLVEGVAGSFTSADKGLDYGAGSGPVAAQMLEKAGYNIELYDPFFWNNPGALEKKYNYIICCEVIEHFHYPLKDFSFFSSCLLPRGALFCMTELYSDKIDFASWYYKNDITHVFFYQYKTIEWICRNMGFNSFKVENRLITLIC